MKKFYRNIVKKIFKNNSVADPQNAKSEYTSTLNSSENVQQQNLGFPEPILYYLKKNASPKLLLQLMKTSKYFLFKEFPFLIIENPRFDENEWLYFDRKNETKILDFETLTKPLWITKEIYCYDNTNDSKAVSKLLSKAVVCDIKFFYLQKQIITFNEFNFLNSSNNITSAFFIYSHVEYGNGNIVLMDKIIKSIPKVAVLVWYFDSKMASTINKKTTKKIFDSIDPSVLTKFGLYNLPQTFDFKLFSKFKKINPKINIFLHFNRNISIKYSKMLQSYVNNFIVTTSKQYYPFQIYFPRQNEKSQDILRKYYLAYRDFKQKQ